MQLLYHVFYSLKTSKALAYAKTGVDDRGKGLHKKWETWKGAMKRAVVKGLWNFEVGLL
jgi:hypothetical protein